MLIHFGTLWDRLSSRSDGSLESLPHTGDGWSPNVPRSGSGQLLEWYCQWLGEQACSVLVLLPEQVRARSAQILPHFGRASPLWYSEDAAPLLPFMGRHGEVWVVNGSRHPIVDWRAAKSAARRHNTDVLVFGPSGAAATGRYAESVLVDETGEVVRLKRHYSDSSTFTDLWSGEASFLVTSGKHAPAVVNHVLARGWGLDSIGALTRRFSVGWSSRPSVFSDVESAHAPAAVIRLGLRRGSGNGNGRTMLPVGSVDPPGRTEDRAYLFLKRVIDLSASAVALIMLSPLLLLVALLVKCTSRGPVLFTHKRQGVGGKEFGCLKFRTMHNGAEALQAELRSRNEVDGPQFKITHDPRLTRLGDWLRRYNIDELPQLVNVLFGQMSLVGPRPSPDDENQLCPAWRRVRLSVKPGITGLWQVLRLRDQHHSDFQEWIYYDVEYGRHRSLWLDWQILLHTPLAMFAEQGLKRFAGRLRDRGICTQSARLAE